MKTLPTTPLLAVLAVAAAACASTTDFTINTGHIGAGGSFEYRGPDGFVWGFTVDDQDLLLTREGTTVVVESVVPETGIDYRSAPSLERPVLTFLPEDGPAIEWNDAAVSRGDRTVRFAAGAGQRL